MKYRVLNPEEMEAYKIGYKVGARELFITEQEWDSEEEYKIYRKGYNAGCKDRERKNLKLELLDCQQCQQCQQCLTQENVSNVDSTIFIKNNNSSKLHTGNNIYYNNTTRARAKFTPPKDANQVYEYGAANGMVCTMKDAEDFFDYYSGIGWCIGNEHRTPMVAWEPFWKKWLRNPVVRQKPSVKMSLKEMKELANEQELQKIRNGER